MTEDKFKITCPLCDEVVFRANEYGSDRVAERPFRGIVKHLEYWHQIHTTSFHIHIADDDRDASVTEEIIAQLGMDSIFK